MEKPKYPPRTSPVANMWMSEPGLEVEKTDEIRSMFERRVAILALDPGLSRQTRDLHLPTQGDMTCIFMNTCILIHICM